MRFNTLDEWLRWQEGLHPAEIDLGLERIAPVARQLQLSPGTARVITVAGTNGKGSTVAFLEAILLAAGYRVGTYTSPHLFQYNERIRLDGQPCADAAICAAFEAVDRARGDISLSYFEFGTLAALQLFQQAELDVWLLEVGLGGRLDAVNILDADCAVITSIGIDHVDWLGDTREAIGAEKAGILRAGRPAVCGDREPPDSVRQRAGELGTPLVVLGEDYEGCPESGSWHWQTTGRVLEQLPLPSLVGRHQLDNASTALMALHALGEALPVGREAIHQGLVQAHQPARFQRVSGAVEQVFDVAHNPEAAEALAAQLAVQPVAGRTLAVYAAYRDKDVAGVVQPLAALVDAWFVSGLTGARGQTGAELVARIPDLTGSPAVYEDAQAAYAAACQLAEPGDRIVVFGSFQLIADLLRQVLKRPDHNEGVQQGG